MDNKKVALVGAAFGFILFVMTGLLPALMYGGYAGILLADGIFGTPLPTHIFARGLVGFGMLLGAFAVCALYVVGGAVAATGFDAAAARARRAARV